MALTTPTVVSRAASRQPGSGSPEAGVESNFNTLGEYSGDAAQHLGTIQNAGGTESADVWYSKTDNVIIVYNA